MANYIINGDRLTSIGYTLRLCDAAPSTTTFTVDEMPKAIATVNPLNLLYGGNFGHGGSYTAIAGNYGTVEVLQNWSVPGSSTPVNNVLHWNITNSPADGTYIRVFYTNQQETPPLKRIVTNWFHNILLYNASDTPLPFRWYTGHAYGQWAETRDYTCQGSSVWAASVMRYYTGLARGSINAQHRVDIAGPYTGDFYLVCVGCAGVDFNHQADISQWEG